METLKVKGPNGLVYTLPKDLAESLARQDDINIVEEKPAPKGKEG